MTSPLGAEPGRAGSSETSITQAKRSRILGPNWFASVIGTGIVAVAAVTLPVQIRGLNVFATIVWMLAWLMLIWLVIARVLHWRRHPQTARRYITDPILAQFFGAPPVARVTVCLGTLLIGHEFLGGSRQPESQTHWVMANSCSLATGCR
ncbi:MAG: hypothetical protein ACOYD0_10710 [Candidatus Nanopelagicales bacterium]